MITEIERKELRKLFQGFYAKEVLLILEEKEIKNRNGKPHNKQYVRLVFQGVRKNKDIEMAIWQLADERKEDIQRKEVQKQKILKRTI